MFRLEKPMTFEEFREAHADQLRRQEAHLGDAAVAEELLREASSGLAWGDWPNAVAVRS